MTRPPVPAVIRASLGSFLEARRVDYLPDAVGHAASHALGTAIGAWIDGDEAAAHPVVVKARFWLRDSAARSERFGSPPVSFAVRRVRAMAVADWLIDNAQPAARYAEAQRLSQAMFDQLHASGPTPEGYVGDEVLPDYLLDCLCARRFRLGVATYRRFGEREIDSAERATGPAELAAALCRAHDAAAPGEPPDWTAAGTRVLRGELAGWLDRGQGIRAAAWLKLVYWDSAAAGTPAEVLALGRAILDRHRALR